MKITRRQLRQIIQEAVRKSEPVTVEISIESGDLSKDKIQFNSKIANTFYALRPRSQIAKLKIGEKLVFNVAKFWSAEIAPDGSKTTLWDGPIEKARKLIWSELPTDDVILKVTYSTPQVEITAGRNLNMAPEQLRQFVKENRDQDLENKRELDAWKAAHPGEPITDFPYYSEKEWGKDYIKSLEKMEESMKITRRQLRQIIKEEVSIVDTKINESMKDFSSLEATLEMLKGKLTSGMASLKKGDVDDSIKWVQSALDIVELAMDEESGLEATYFDAVGHYERNKQK